MEKHSAPDNVNIMWDAENYPVIDKESIYIHGRYCQSGFATRKTDWEAECITINKISLSYNETKTFETTLECQPDGKTECIYKKGDKEAFRLKCECGLVGNKGYCPIP